MFFFHLNIIIFIVLIKQLPFHIDASGPSLCTRRTGSLYSAEFAEGTCISTQLPGILIIIDLTMGSRELNMLKQHILDTLMGMPPDTLVGVMAYDAEVYVSILSILHKFLKQVS